VERSIAGLEKPRSHHPSQACLGAGALVSGKRCRKCLAKLAYSADTATLGFSLFNLSDANRVSLDLDGITGSGDLSTLAADLSLFTGLGHGRALIGSLRLILPPSAFSTPTECPMRCRRCLKPLRLQPHPQSARKD
jgi:hypothetical protein